MFVIVGSLVVMGSIILGYVMHGGHLGILIQINELIIIGGAAIGSLLIANPLSVSKRVFSGALSTFKGSKINKKSYEELLQAMYALMQVARRDGMIALEPHFEKPKESAIFKKAPTLIGNHHALHFLCDTLRNIGHG